MASHDEPKSSDTNEQQSDIPHLEIPPRRSAREIPPLRSPRTIPQISKEAVALRRPPKVAISISSDSGYGSVAGSMESGVIRQEASRSLRYWDDGSLFGPSEQRDPSTLVSMAESQQQDGLWNTADDPETQLLIEEDFQTPYEVSDLDPETWWLTENTAQSLRMHNDALYEVEDSIPHDVSVVSLTRADTTINEPSFPIQLGAHKDNTCPLCQKSFKYSGALTSHLRSHSRPFKCQVENCRFRFDGFASRSIANRHFDTVHALDPTIYKCKLHGCAYVTKRKDNLKSHERKVHGLNHIPEGHQLAPKEARPASTSNRKSPDQVIQSELISYVGYALKPKEATDVTASSRPLSLDISDDEDEQERSYVPWNSPNTRIDKLENQMKEFDSSFTLRTTRQRSLDLHEGDDAVTLQLAEESEKTITPQKSPTEGCVESTECDEESLDSLMSSDPEANLRGGRRGPGRAGNLRQGSPSKSPSSGVKAAREHQKRKRDTNDERGDQEDEEDERQQKLLKITEGRLPCIYRFQWPDDYSIDTGYPACHTTHTNFASLLDHLVRTHNFVVDPQYILQFLLDDTDSNLVAVCRRCWGSTRSRTALAAHVAARTCMQRNPDMYDKWDILRRAYCTVTNTPSPSSTELQPQGPQTREGTEETMAQATDEIQHSPQDTRSPTDPALNSPVVVGETTDNSTSSTSQALPYVIQQARMDNVISLRDGLHAFRNEVSDLRTEVLDIRDRTQTLRAELRSLRELVDRLTVSPQHQLQHHHQDHQQQQQDTANSETSSTNSTLDAASEPPVTAQPPPLGTDIFMHPPRARNTDLRGVGFELAMQPSAERPAPLALLADVDAMGSSSVQGSSEHARLPPLRYANTVHADSADQNLHGVHLAQQYQPKLHTSDDVDSTYGSGPGTQAQPSLRSEPIDNAAQVFPHSEQESYSYDDEGSNGSILEFLRSSPLNEDMPMSDFLHEDSENLETSAGSVGGQSLEQRNDFVDFDW